MAGPKIWEKIKAYPFLPNVSERELYVRNFDGRAFLLWSNTANNQWGLNVRLPLVTVDGEDRQYMATVIPPMGGAVDFELANVRIARFKPAKVKWVFKKFDGRLKNITFETIQTHLKEIDDEKQ